MDNFDTIFDAFRNCITNPKCKDCPWEYCKKLNQTRVEIPLDLCLDVVELLKEQNKTIESLEYSLAVAQNNLNYYINGND